MRLFDLSGIQKTFGGVRALQWNPQDSCTIEIGQVWAFAGENGAGKSTLAALLAGLTAPTGGSILLDGQPYLPGSVADARAKGVQIVLQEPALVPSLTIAENLFLGREREFSTLGLRRRGRMLSEARKLLADICPHIDPAANARDLALEDQKLVETARAVSTNPRCIIFDETTAAMPAWPGAPHGLYVDKQGNVWIGGTGSPWNSDPGTAKPTDAQPWDRQVLKFSSDGKLLLQIGKPSNAPVNNEDTTLLGAPSAIKVDDAANEVYIADGFFNKRVVVYDSNTGGFKRGWGAYGISLSKVDNSTPAVFPVSRTDLSAPPSKQFAGISDIAISADKLVYVTDQTNDRIQVFTKAGKFVKEFFVAPKEFGYESAWGIALSRDPKQQYLFVTDGASGVIRIFDRRNGTELDKFGHKGRDTGEFSNLGWVVLDSEGALYTGEVHFTRSWDAVQSALSGKSYTPGGRLQKFVHVE